jgi:hypothetical protein
MIHSNFAPPSQGGETMHWDRKFFGTIANALSNHLKKTGKNTQRGYVLLEIHETAMKYSKYHRADSCILDQLKLALCSECRLSQLYECDVPVGWSHNCALLQHNECDFNQE